MKQSQAQVLLVSSCCQKHLIFLHHPLLRSPPEFLHQLGILYTSSASTASTFLHLCLSLVMCLCVSLRRGLVLPSSIVPHGTKNIRKLAIWWKYSSDHIKRTFDVRGRQNPSMVIEQNDTIIPNIGTGNFLYNKVHFVNDNWIFVLSADMHLCMSAEKTIDVEAFWVPFWVTS